MIIRSNTTTDWSSIVIVRKLLAVARQTRNLHTERLQDQNCVEQQHRGSRNYRCGSGQSAVSAARRLHRNVLVIALANKLARIALTVLVQGRSYETRIESAAA